MGAARQIRSLLGNVKGRRIVVLAGPGNNGGDGLVAARHLHDWGAETRVYLLAKRRADDENYRELVKREIDVADAEDDPSFAALARFLSDAELIVDALIGTGKPRPIEANSGRRPGPRPPGPPGGAAAAARRRRPADGRGVRYRRRRPALPAGGPDRRARLLQDRPAHAARLRNTPVASRSSISACPAARRRRRKWS